MDVQAIRSQTIKFNVGGRHFEVLRDLIEKQPESMLGRGVSETWQHDPEKTIFFDRDGDIFAQVLNYLRYGTIVLPTNMPKEMFIRDLDFYVLDYNDEVIKDGDKVLAELKEVIEENKRLEEANAKVKEENGALRAIEITGPNHQPVYARGHVNKDGLVRGTDGMRCCRVVLKQVSPCLLENLNAVEVWIGGSLREVVSDVLNSIDGDWVAVFPIPNEPESFYPGQFTVGIRIEWSTEELESLRSIDIGPHDISRLYSDLVQVLAQQLDKSKTASSIVFFFPLLRMRDF
mmetsp:Transcript_10495/g.18961  ORF Transcript_10495/g.18961 Transcript_10495/m.18961 type:complete len:289 (+) Transcript_10495:248-1114(+)